MTWTHPLDAVAERLILIGRLALSAITVGLLELQPMGVFRNQAALLALAWIWLIYAVAVAALGPAAQVRFAAYRGVTHLVDVGIAAAIIWVAADAATPFRVVGAFVILAAAVRFGWRAILATTVLVIAVMGAVAVRNRMLLHDPEYRMAHLATGLAFLAVMAAILVRLRSRDARTRADLERLASWTRSPLSEPRELLRETLERAAGVLRARRALLLWEEAEEPWLHIAIWADGELRWFREPPHRYAPIVAPAVEGKSFVERHTPGRKPIVLCREGDAIRTLRVPPLHAELAALVPDPARLSVRVEGETIEGRLVLSGSDGWTIDAILAAEIVADLVAARLDQWRAVEASQEMAVREERIRLARDLHDGLLQSLTGVALHLQTAQRQIATDPDAAVKSLEELQDVIASDQRELRGFIQQLRPYGGSVTATARLTGRLDDLGSRFKNQFGLNVRMNTESLSPLVSDEMRFEIFALVNEGLANVAKHAEANNVAVDLTSDTSEIRIIIADDGKGFPFHGTYDLAELSRMKRGPLSLKERIASLGGNLIIDSSESGARLDIRIPR
ncbi:MAG: sensor histidine kinase [Thermoanaerobaculia bacterium]